MSSEPTLTFRGDTGWLGLFQTRVPDVLAHQVVISDLIVLLTKLGYVGFPALKILCHINEGDFNPWLVILWLSMVYQDTHTPCHSDMTSLTIVPRYLSRPFSSSSLADLKQNATVICSSDMFLLHTEATQQTAKYMWK